MITSIYLHFLQFSMNIHLVFADKQSEHNSEKEVIILISV